MSTLARRDCHRKPPTATASTGLRTPFRYLTMQTSLTRPVGLGMGRQVSQGSNLAVWEGAGFHAVVHVVVNEPLLLYFINGVSLPCITKTSCTTVGGKFTTTTPTPLVCTAVCPYAGPACMCQGKSTHFDSSASACRPLTSAYQAGPTHGFAGGTNRLAQCKTPTA